jgi:alpha-1,2-mannosyltransferase
LESRKPRTSTILLCLLVPRLLSSLYNIIHDCDEVYNYWEPLHFLLYGYGMQTWEYR